MNNTLIIRYVLRAVLLLAFQVLVLNKIMVGSGIFNHITLFLYPVFLMYWPINTPTWLLLLVGFVYGLGIDIFSDTMGMHAATGVFSAFLRSGYLRLLEPQGGYKEGVSPTRRTMGFIWFLRYIALFMFLHCFLFFSVEEFTPFYWKKILFATIPSYVLSLVVVLVYSFLFDPAD